MTPSAVIVKQPFRILVFHAVCSCGTAICSPVGALRDFASASSVGSPEMSRIYLSQRLRQFFGVRLAVPSTIPSSPSLTQTGRRSSMPAARTFCINLTPRTQANTPDGSARRRWPCHRNRASSSHELLAYSSSALSQYSSKKARSVDERVYSVTCL